MISEELDNLHVFGICKPSTLGRSKLSHFVNDISLKISSMRKGSCFDVMC